MHYAIWPNCGVSIVKTKNTKSLYRRQKDHARSRNIQFLLTYEEWLKIWLDSGHFHERGRQKGQYCMARLGDKGPYAVGNVKIILHQDNNREQVYSSEACAMRSRAVAGNKNPFFGKRHSDEMLTKMSRRRSELFIDYLGNSMPLDQAVYAAGNVISITGAYYRLRNGWPHREAVEMPPYTKKRQWPSLKLS